MNLLVGAGILAATLSAFWGGQSGERVEQGQVHEHVQGRDWQAAGRSGGGGPKNEAAGKVREVEIDFAEKLEDGNKKSLRVGEGENDKVLISRYAGKLYATGNFCSHFGVPLEYGQMFDDKVLCPAHAAGFSVVTGYPEQAPGRDGIPTFPIVTREGKHFVQVPEDGLPKKATQPLTPRDPNNKTHFVIIGGGPAGLNCAETLRQSGFSGRITVLAKEGVVPYDRTLLSKALPMLEPGKAPLLRPPPFLQDASIEIRTGTTVDKVDGTAKTIKLASGEEVSFDKLCIATGATPVLPPVEGNNLKGVHTLRTKQDQEAIRGLAESAKTVVIIGGSWIATECAASLVSKHKTNLKVNLVCSTSVPFERSLGKEVGEVFKKEHEANGVNVISEARLKKIIGNADGTVKGVELSNGTCVDADLVILGTGVKPATQFLGDSGLDMKEDGGLVCNPYLQTSNKDIFAAGDIVHYPYWPTGERVRTEHWIVALDQGSYAAFNMLGKVLPYAAIPFFWTRNYNKSLQYAGNGSGFKDIHITGDLSEQKFVAYYINDRD